MMVKRHAFGLKHESNRLLVLLFTITACVGLTFYVGFIRGQEIVYPHFFYIPIVLAGMWYHKKAVYVALFLSIVHILVTHLSPPVVAIDNFATCAILITVAYVIGLISEKRAKTQEVLTASKAYTESIIQNFLDTLIVVDAEAKIQTLNPETCYLLSYTEEELIRQPIGTIFAEEEEEEEVRRVFQFFREPQKADALRPQNTVRNRELTYKTKDGRLIPMSFNASVLTDEAGNVTSVVAGAKDVTKLKLAETEIRKEKIFSENIIATIPDSLLVLDKNLGIKDANRTFYGTFQTESEKVIGSSIAETLQDKDGKLSTELTKLFETKDMLENFELHYQSEKLGERIFNITARGMLIAEEEEEEELVVMEDISKRKKAEEALRKSEERYRSLVESTEDSIYLVDRNCRYLFMNKKYLSRFHLPIDKVIGRTYSEFHSEEETKKFAEKVKKVFETGKSLWYEHRSRRDSRYFLRTLSPVKEPGGRAIAVNVISKEITKRRRMEETLIRSERLKALGGMAAGIAHNFNNLLAIILGNAQLLEKGLRRYKTEEIKDRLKIIARTAYEGGKTVKRLQHFTRRESPREDFTRIDLNEIVRSAVASTSPRWKDEAETKGITTKIKEELGKIPPLWGSRSELMEVLTNLIFNALEAVREGGEITIRTKAKENKVYLYFTDTGQGIPDKIKDKIFDPFFTTKGPKASGLGLSISYGIIKRHQGKIKVKSTKGKGTTFTISIPIRLKAPLKKEKLAVPRKISSRKISSRKILVIDDEEGIREVLGEIFQDEGHRVTLAETARKGLDKFKQDNFDLVLTDLGMPEMSGWQLAKKIKEIDPDVPVGLITGWAVATTKEKMKKEGVDFILSKPFDYTKVLREVNAVPKCKKR